MIEYLNGKLESGYIDVTPYALVCFSVSMPSERLNIHELDE